MIATSTTKLPIVYLFGAGLVGTMLRDALTEAGDVMVVTDSMISPKIKIASTPAEVDLESVYLRLEKSFGPPSLLINAIGVIGKPNVDWCEDHKEETKYGNTDIAVGMARLAEKMNVPLIHISTGCIFSDFDGRVFMPGDEPNFSGSYYSWTKMEAEKQIREVFDASTNLRIEIHRIRMPFMQESSPRNLINKLLKYDTLVDSPNSMTCLEDYAQFVVKRVKGIIGYIGVKWMYTYHAVNKGAIAHSEIVSFLREFSDIKVGEKKYITPQELNTMTKVPRSTCVMGDEQLPDVRASLLNIIRNFKYVE